MNGYPFFRIICGSRVVIYIISLLNVGEKKIETKRDEAGDRRDCLIITVFNHNWYIETHNKKMGNFLTNRHLIHLHKQIGEK